jgi:MFS family permease
VTTASTHLARHHAIGPALAAAAVLAIGMGFGRFAFTGLYPVMVHDGFLTVHSGTLAASANYAGYLIGALLVSNAKPVHARGLCIWATAGGIVCMAALGVLHGTWAIVAVRGLAGVCSALSMVAASLWLLQHMGYARDAPLLYAGVGVGIVFSAELIAVGQHVGFGSSALWAVLSAASFVLAIAAFPALRSRPEPEPAPMFDLRPSAGPPGTGAPIAQAVRLILIYGLAGFGYIVTATYLPFFIRDALGSVDPIHVWAVFGFGAVPSCFFWHSLQVRMGTRHSLMSNLAVQAIGVVLPVFSHTAAAYLLSAFLVGGTFVGTVTIAMPAARRVAHAVRFNMLAVMTAVYGVGQIIGPLVANAILASTQSFTGSLLSAAGALIVAAALSAQL